MEDSNKRKWASGFFFLTEPSLDILSLWHIHVFFITKAIVFSAIIQCIQDFSGWFFFYIETSVTSAMFKYLTHPPPFNKICLITITNFFLLTTISFFVTNNKSVWSLESRPPLADALTETERILCVHCTTVIYTTVGKKTHTSVTQVPGKTESPFVTVDSLRLWLIN